MDVFPGLTSWAKFRRPCGTEARDLAVHNGRKLESVPQSVLDDVLAKLATLFA